MRRLLTICCGAALVIAAGCQPTTTPGTPFQRLTERQEQGQRPDALTEQERRELNEIKQLLQQTDLTVSSLAEEVQRQQERRRMEGGPPDVVKDLFPTLRVLGTAKEAVLAHRVRAVPHELRRLDQLVGVLISDLPASKIVMHCERALTHLQADEPDLEGASAELTLAYDIAHDPKLPRLRPAGVDALIQTNAKSQINAGRPDEAVEVIQTALEKAGGHWSLDLLDRVRDGIVAAEDAVRREAWPVVQVELVEVEGNLNKLAEEVHLRGYGGYAAEPLEGVERAEREEVEGAAEAEMEAEEPGEVQETEAAEEPEAKAAETESTEEEPAPTRRRPSR